jgi:hypothetical protein
LSGNNAGRDLGVSVSPGISPAQLRSRSTALMKRITAIVFVFVPIYIEIAIARASKPTLIVSSPAQQSQHRGSGTLIGHFAPGSSTIHALSHAAVQTTLPFHETNYHCYHVYLQQLSFLSLARKRN